MSGLSALLAALALAATACTPSADRPPAAPADLDEIAAVDLAWWFSCPDRSSEPEACLSGIGGAPFGPARVVGPAREVVVDQGGTVVTGEGLGTVRVSAPDVTLDGITAEVVVFGPGADGGRLLRSRVGSVFVSGADGVALLTNLLRPAEAGPDVVQVKQVDGDPVRGLVVAGNVIGPQPGDAERHTDCVQVLDGDDLLFVRNLVGPCGDKAFQIRSGAGGVVAGVTLAWNFVLECRPRRPGCDGFHAVIWAATEEARLTLVRNSVRGSVALSTSGSTRPAAGRLVTIGNIADSLPCTAPGDAEANLVVEGPDPHCPGQVAGEVSWVAPDEGDLHLAGVSGEVGSPVVVAGELAALADGPDVDGDYPCGAGSGHGADVDCPEAGPATTDGDGAG